MEEVNFEAILGLRLQSAGQELIKFLNGLIHEDVIALATKTDGNDSAKVGLLQGQIIRTQAILHLLQAEIVDESEEEAN